MNQTRIFSLFAIFLTLGFSALFILADHAEARRSGRKSSSGSHGSRSFSKPRQATPPKINRSPQSDTTHQKSKQKTASTTQNQPNKQSGLTSGLGGLLLGGMIGALLFGGDQPIGLLHILIIGALIWFAMRWFKQNKHRNQGAG